MSDNCKKEEYNFEKIRKDISFHKWHEYEPMDAQFIRFIKADPSVLAAAHKINDVYHSFCNARALLMYSQYNDYGELCSSDDISRLEIKTHFLKDALIEYGICLDISWQVIWAYFQPSSIEYLLQNKFEEMERECTSENVHAQLNCAISQKNEKAKNVKEILTLFENDPDVKELRELYNAIKHRGILHFDGFSAENMTAFYFAQNIKMPLLRKTYKFENIERLLYRYYGTFKDYFENIVKIIIPEEYLDNNMNVIDFMFVIEEIERIRNNKL